MMKLQFIDIGNLFRIIGKIAKISKDRSVLKELM